MKTFLIQYDQRTSNGRHVKLLKEMIEGLNDVRKQRRLDANSNDSPMHAGWIAHKISEMFVKSDQGPFFLPGLIHHLIIGNTEHSDFFGMDDIKVHASKKDSNGRRHVFIQQEFRHQADRSKRTYSASRIRPAA